MQERPKHASITREVLQSLAQVHGVDIPNERLDPVLKQYQNYLETLEQLESLPLPRESEPEITFRLKR